MKRGKHYRYVGGDGRIFKHGRRSLECYIGPSAPVSRSGGGTGLEDTEVSEDSEDHKHGLACLVAKGYVAAEKFKKKYEMRISIGIIGLCGSYLAVLLGLYLSTVMTAQRWTVAAWVTAGLAIFVVICCGAKWCEDNFHRIGKWARKKARDC